MRQWKPRAEWLIEQRAYMESDAWRQKREMVMRRCNGMCEGCGLNKAIHVHHRSYDNFGEEFLWELFAVCRTCHERLHKRPVGN